LKLFREGVGDAVLEVVEWPARCLRCMVTTRLSGSSSEPITVSLQSLKKRLA